jgi:alanyl-tRNA synthetase
MRGIDTGAGLERNLCVLQGVTSVYETDVLAGLVERAQSVTGRRLGDDPQADVALRLLADHARTITFLVNDGVLPGNEDRGYVLRRIIRRAVRFAHLLGVDQLVMPPMIGATVELMGDAYPEIRTNADTITGLVEREEARFRTTLKTGSDLLEAELSGLGEGGVLPGSVAFRLHDTYGFPLDVTREVVAERGVTVDDEGFEAEMAAQRRRAKEARKGGGIDESALETYRQVLDVAGPTEFTGREEVETKAVVVAVLPGPDGTVEVFLDRSPFYAESGGQVGDTGTIRTATGVVEVVDTTYALPGPAPPHRSGGGRRGARRPGGHGCLRRGAPGRHPSQPHGHAPPALGAARGPGRPRQAAGLVRRARVPAVRLQPPRGGDARPARPHRGPRQRRGPQQRPGAPLRDQQGGGRRARRHRLLR